MATASLSAESRTDTGTGAARKLRAGRQVPGRHLRPRPRAAVARAQRARAREAARARLRRQHGLRAHASTARRPRTLIREIQRHPFKRTILHVDFQELVAGEKVTVEHPARVRRHARGRAQRRAASSSRSMHAASASRRSVEHPEPHRRRRHAARRSATRIHVRDLKLPAGVEVLDDEDATVCVVRRAARRGRGDTGRAARRRAAAEPELIRKPKEDEEEAK